MGQARVVSVNVVHELIHGSRGSWSGIDKRPVSGRVRVGRLGVEGDVQYDKRYHGGPDQAVYAYAAEGAQWWAGEIGRDVPPGQLGENLTTQGVDVTGAVVGELWRVGSTLLQPILPRIPCRKFAGLLGGAKAGQALHRARRLRRLPARAGGGRRRGR
jgi:MOSC domain-containing protein YiiM